MNGFGGILRKRRTTAASVAVVLSASVLAVVPTGSASAVEPQLAWSLNNSFTGTNGDITCQYGSHGSQPIVGDWDASGSDSPGVHVDGRWWPSSSCGGVGDYAYDFGLPTDIPVVGDWNGDGFDTPGVFRNGWFYVSNEYNGVASWGFPFGSIGDIPVVGDWDGDGRDTIGIRRGNMFHLSDSLNSAPPNRSIMYGDPEDEPVVGDWNGDGIDTVGVHRGNMWYLSDGFDDSIEYAFMYGDPDHMAVVGDWDGDGDDTPGVVLDDVQEGSVPAPTQTATEKVSMGGPSSGDYCKGKYGPLQKVNSTLEWGAWVQCTWAVPKSVFVRLERWQDKTKKYPVAGFRIVEEARDTAPSYDVAVVSKAEACRSNAMTTYRMWMLPSADGVTWSPTSLDPYSTYVRVPCRTRLKYPK